MKRNAITSNNAIPDDMPSTPDPGIMLGHSREESAQPCMCSSAQTSIALREEINDGKCEMLAISSNGKITD
jgi:hypothetical protein